MRRALSLFLIAAGILTILVGIFMTAAAIANLRVGGEVILVVAVVAGLGGTFILLLGVYLLQRKRTGAAQDVIDGRVGSYLADQVEQRAHQLGTYEVHYQKPVKGKNGRPSSLVIRVSAEAPTTLQFTDETWFDRVCKQYGLTREHQTGDRNFDERIFIRGPSDGYAEEYLADHRKRTAILNLRSLGFKEVRLTGTTIEAVWQGFNPMVDDQASLPTDAAKHLFVLAADLPAPDVERHAASPGHHGFWNVFLWIVTLGYAALIGFAFHYPPIRTWTLFWTGMTLFIAVYLALGGLAGAALRGASISHDRWARLMCVGVFLTGLGSVGAVALANGSLDDAPLEQRSLTITDKRTRTHRRSTSYHVSVPAWDHPGDVLEFRVSSGDYARIATGRSKLELTTGRGWLGIEWVKRQHIQP